MRLEDWSSNGSSILSEITILKYTQCYIDSVNPRVDLYQNSDDDIANIVENLPD